MDLGDLCCFSFLLLFWDRGRSYSNFLASAVLGWGVGNSKDHDIVAMGSNIALLAFTDGGLYVVS